MVPKSVSEGAMADQQSKAGSKGEISEELTKFG
jgi:hypothetical protein